MSKTTHPFAFRLGFLHNWKSRWFNNKNYRKLLKSDTLLREELERKMKGMYIKDIEIERGHSFLHVIVKTSRPGLVIGRKGEGADNIKKDILKILQKTGSEIPREIKLTIEEVPMPETCAKIAGQMAAENLEKRMSFKRVMRQVIEKALANKDVKGAKVMLSGRLDGSEMGRRESLRKGQVPLQTIRGNIDFARVRAHLPYGDIGIKVWIYKGNK